jgi:hypothetical protein
MAIASLAAPTAMVTLATLLRWQGLSNERLCR